MIRIPRENPVNALTEARITINRDTMTEPVVTEKNISFNSWVLAYDHKRRYIPKRKYTSGLTIIAVPSIQ